MIHLPAFPAVFPVSILEIWILPGLPPHQGQDGLAEEFSPNVS